MDRPGGKVILGNLKGMTRAAEKVRDDYGGDWSKLQDIARATVSVDSHHELHHAVQWLRDSGMKLARAPKDFFQTPTPEGYRGANTSWMTPNGHIVEVQFQTNDMQRAKALGHPHYNITRKLDAKRRITGTLSDEDESTHARHMLAQQELYGDAWNKRVDRMSNNIEKSIADHRKIRGKRMARTPNNNPFLFRTRKHFDWDGRPAYMETSRHPVTVLVGKEWKQDHRVSKMYHESHEITKREFDNLVQHHLGGR